MSATISDHVFMSPVGDKRGCTGDTWGHILGTIKHWGQSMGTCTECHEREPKEGRTICETCRKRLQRAKKKEPVIPMFPEQMQQAINHTASYQLPPVKPRPPHPAYKPSHAQRVSEGTPGAVKRSLNSGKFEWVIPGAHFVGKVDPDWTTCLNPDCIHWGQNLDELQARLHGQAPR